jgi:DNA-binding NarL/FixJ family response regulator
LYAADPDKAGELAISAIELILTGEISSDDIMIGIMLEPTKKVTERNVVKYEAKMENSKQKKIKDMKLQEIADLLNEGCRQKFIAERLGLSQQVVSYRVDVIKKKYPELLTGQDEEKEKEQVGVVEEETSIVYSPGFHF